MQESEEGNGLSEAVTVESQLVRARLNCSARALGSFLSDWQDGARNLAVSEATSAGSI